MTINSNAAVTVKLKVTLSIAEDNVTEVVYRKVVVDDLGAELFEIEPATVFPMFNDLKDALVDVVQPILSQVLLNV